MNKKILVIDDCKSVVQLLVDFLEDKSYTVKSATTGPEALNILSNFTPDLILLDIIMPDMDGYEICHRIKARYDSPIIFLSSCDKEQDVVKGLNAGAVDYIRKPIRLWEVAARIKTHLHIAHLNSENQDLVEDLMFEQNKAYAVFQNITGNKLAEIDIMKYWVSPLAMFNGDLVMGAHSFDHYYIILGDFTGHGLAAAIGIIPLTEIFYSMCTKHYTIDAIIAEMNKKLFTLLPRGMFCAAMVIDYDVNRHTVSCWNGGMPSALWVNKENCIEETCLSTSVPLGVLSHEEFEVNLTSIPVNSEDRLYLFTDGVTEMTDEQGEMYDDRLLKKVIKNSTIDECFDNIVTQLLSLKEAEQQDDDFTVLEINVPTKKKTLLC